MLPIYVSGRDIFLEESNTFVTIKDVTLKLEHSLASLSKWESKWKKPFLGDDEKTQEEYADYIRCMTLNRDVDPMVFNVLTRSQIDQVNKYIEDSMTATWFNEKRGGPKNREIVTSEIIYYWMVALSIPFECEKWHLNRLLTLIRVCNLKNAPQKKMSRRDAGSRQRALNNARRNRMHTRG